MSLITYLNPDVIKDDSIEGIKLKDGSIDAIKIKDGAISASKIDETIASKSYVDNTIASAITASDAMVFKGTLGTGGTTESIPSTAIIGDTYKVISLTTIPLESSYTGAEENAKVGDLVVAISADPKWIVVPSGDDEIKKLIQSITWGDLKAKRDAGELTPGMQYRITDYQCTTTQEDTRSAGHQFDIIVRADSENKLNEEASAIQHEGDEYFANSNLSAWKIWYCLDNDTDRFAWAMIGELIDTIKPTNGNASGTYTYNVPISNIKYYSTVYNLKIGIKTTINSGPPVYVTKTDDYTLVVEDQFNWIKEGELSVYTISQKGNGIIYRTIDEFNNDIPYDFKNIQFKHPLNTTEYPYFYYTFASSNVEDNTDYSLSASKNVYANKMLPYIIEYKQNINKILFFGRYCYYNTFKNNCYKNTFENGCAYNIFKNNCSSNSFGIDCSHNYFGDSCFSNSFGNDCFNNTFGYYCHSNTFGNDHEYNTFGNCCHHIKFTSDSSESIKYNYYRYNHFGDGCEYILFKGAETASSSANVENYSFAKELRGTLSNYLTIDGVRNRAYETKVAKNSNGELKIYCEADLIA